MAKPKWGTKRFCDDCGTRFYDLNRAPVTCPKCDARIKIVTVPKSRRGTKPVDPKPEPLPIQDNEPANDKNDTGIDGLDDDQVGGVGDDVKDGDLIEDTSDLTKDDDDVSEVLEHVDNGKEDKA